MWGPYSEKDWQNIQQDNNYVIKVSMSWHKAESVALSPWANYPSQSAPLKNQIKPTCKTFNIKPGTYGYLITHY